MKKILSVLLACGMFASAFSQNEPLEPCCTVMNINAATNTVLVRNNTSGRLHQFKADAMDMRSIRKGDGVNITGNKVSAINGSTRVYVTVRPDYAEPCCSVVSIQVDGVEPCCAAVTIKNSSSNKNFSISVPKQIAATLRTGQAVSVDAANNLAVVQSTYGGNGQMNSFGYPATAGEETTGNANETEKWVISPVPSMKGVLGRLNINYPAGVDRWILLYRPADNKYLGSVSENDKTYTLGPGEYRFLITDVPVENVPIQKGHETRIRIGFLNVVSEGGFYLYNNTKEKLYTTYDKPKKIALPVGSYQVKLGGQFYPFTIKDKETVEY